MTETDKSASRYIVTPAGVRTDQTLAEALGVGEDAAAGIRHDLREDFRRIDAAERAARKTSEETLTT